MLLLLIQLGNYSCENTLTPVPFNLLEARSLAAAQPGLPFLVRNVKYHGRQAESDADVYCCASHPEPGHLCLQVHHPLPLPTGEAVLALSLLRCALSFSHHRRLTVRSRKSSAIYAAGMALRGQEHHYTWWILTSLFFWREGGAEMIQG